MGTYLHSLATFIFEVQLYFACKILFRMVGSGGWMGVEIKTNSAQLGLGLSLAKICFYVLFIRVNNFAFDDDGDGQK